MFVLQLKLPGLTAKADFSPFVPSTSMWEPSSSSFLSLNNTRKPLTQLQRWKITTLQLVVLQHFMHVCFWTLLQFKDKTFRQEKAVHDQKLNSKKKKQIKKNPEFTPQSDQKTTLLLHFPCIVVCLSRGVFLGWCEMAGQTSCASQLKFIHYKLTHQTPKQEVCNISRFVVCLRSCRCIKKLSSRCFSNTLLTITCLLT